MSLASPWSPPRPASAGLARPVVPLPLPGVAAPSVPEFPKPADGPGCRSPVWATILGVECGPAWRPESRALVGRRWPLAEDAEDGARPRGPRGGCGAQGVDGARRGTRSLAAGLAAPGDPSGQSVHTQTLSQGSASTQPPRPVGNPTGAAAEDPGELASSRFQKLASREARPLSRKRLWSGAPDRLLCAEAARAAEVGTSPAPSLPGPDYTMPPRAGTQGRKCPIWFGEGPCGSGCRGCGAGGPAERPAHPGSRARVLREREGHLPGALVSGAPHSPPAGANPVRE